MGWWITLGVLILLGLIPLGASAKYNAEGPNVRVIIGPVRFTVYPRPKKEKKPRKKPKSRLRRKPKLPLRTRPLPKRICAPLLKRKRAEVGQISFRW